MRACAYPYAYRSRARMQLRGAGLKASVGFFRCGSHQIVDVDSCPLFRKSLNEALASLRQFKLKVDVDPGPQEMDMACSEEEDAWATSRPGSNVDEGVTPLLGTRKREEVLLHRKVGGFTYAVTASVFFQANDFMVSELVELVLQAAEGSGHDSALDLFSGVGLFSLPLARRFANVVAVENSPAAVKLCSQNANSAGLGNVQSVCSDVPVWMESREAAAPALDLLLLDPPRTGAGSATMEQIRKWGPRIIVYVSCDPQTLIRDLAAVVPRDYSIRLVAGLDMFPQTYHFETVVRLEKH